MPYTPGTTKADTVEELRDFIERELTQIAREFSETTVVELRPIYAAPKKPREGMIVSADGVEWNPGSGAGSYEYRGGAWVKL